MYDEKRIALSYAQESNLEIPCPKGLEYRPFQKACIEFTLFNPYIHTLIGDEPGLGKTVESIGVINFRPGFPVLVICPASLIINWRKEFEKWSVKKLTYQEINTSSQELEKVDVYIVSYNLLTYPKLFNRLIKKKFFYLIIDEVHYIKNIRSQRSKAVYGSPKTIGFAYKSKYIMALSGTAAPNRPLELYPLLRIICPESITEGRVPLDYDKFGFKFCGGHFRDGKLDFRGSSNEEELGKRLRSTFMIRRLKKDVLHDLPDKNYSLVYLKNTNESREIVQQMAEFDLSEILSKGAAPSYEGLSECRRQLGEIKAPIAVEYIKGKLNEHEKIIIFAHHRDCISLLFGSLDDYNPSLIWGATPKNDRQGIVDKFQEDKTNRVIICSITAAGVGLTLTAASYVIVVEASWVPGENDQAVDRCHRIGQKNSVQADFLVFENSLDENIISSHMRKTKNINAIMEAK